MKKIWSILLAGLLCIGILAGCAPAGQPDTSATPEAAAVSAAPSVSATASAPADPSPSVSAAPTSGAGTQASLDPTASASVGDKDKKAADGDSADAPVNGAGNGAANTPAPQKTPEPVQEQANTITCTISIDCQTALNADADLANAVSSGGTILGSKKVTLDQGASVYDALKATGITFSGKSYISSINSLGEGDCGPQSGWMYSVNGEYPGVGCTKYTLADGDNIKWRYTCDMGADIGA